MNLFGRRVKQTSSRPRGRLVKIAGMKKVKGLYIAKAKRGLKVTGFQVEGIKENPKARESKHYYVRKEPAGTWVVRSRDSLGVVTRKPTAKEAISAMRQLEPERRENTSIRESKRYFKAVAGSAYHTRTGSDLRRRIKDLRIRGSKAAKKR